MKNYAIFYLLALSLVIHSSCSNTRDIAMFQETKNNVTRYHIPNKGKEHKIKPHDNLYISILTLDPEINILFNPSFPGNGIMSGTEQMYGSPASQYINGYMISEEGAINLPILGEIKLAGLNLKQAEEQLKIKAEEYLKEPIIQVKYLNYKVNVSGEIRRPGIYYNYEGNINILDAIDMAMGITDYANLKNVIVKRHIGERITTYNVDLTDNSIFSSEVFYLQPNDMIYIPPSNLKRRRENSQTYSQVLSTISTLLVAAALFINL